MCTIVQTEPVAIFIASFWTKRGTCAIGDCKSAPGKNDSRTFLPLLHFRMLTDYYELAQSVL